MASPTPRQRRASLATGRGAAPLPLGSLTASSSIDGQRQGGLSPPAQLVHSSLGVLLSWRRDRATLGTPSREGSRRLVLTEAVGSVFAGSSSQWAPPASPAPAYTAPGVPLCPADLRGPEAQGTACSPSAQALPPGPPPSSYFSLSAGPPPPESSPAVLSSPVPSSGAFVTTRSCLPLPVAP